MSRHVEETQVAVAPSPNGDRAPGSAVRVSRINVTPVKSLRLHHPGEVWLDRYGVAEDRRFVLVDDTDRVYNGNRGPVLVRAEAAWDAPSRRLTITVPGAGTVDGDVVRGSSTVVVVYGRKVRGHVVEGPWADALSDLTGRSLTLVEREDDAWATDIAPSTIISQASLDLLGGDGRRFRMLLELEGPGALEEETWRNRRVRVGEATLLVGTPTPRCSTPSADPDTGLRDRDSLRQVIDARGAVDGGACLGVYADVLVPGLVRVGDAVELASTAHRPTAQVIDRIRVSSRRLGKLRRTSVL
jgi:hypothetical protein